MGKIKQTLNTIKSNWKTAPEGSYVPYKEIAAYSVGGTGVYFITAIVGMIGIRPTIAAIKKKKDIAALAISFFC